MSKNLDNDGYYHVRNIANIEKDNRTMSTNEVITKYKPFKRCYTNQSLIIIKK